MRKQNSHSPKSLLSERRQAQSTKNLTDFIVRTIERKTGSKLQELKRTRKEKELYHIGLYHVTTTNKTICEALKIPVEAGTRRKRDLEKEGRLVASRKKGICPFTKYSARLLTTNPNQFRELLK